MRRLTRDPAELIPLKHATYQVLLALGDGESMHGYAIMQAVSAMTEGREAILPGTLYAALARMVDEGLVAESDRAGRCERRAGAALLPPHQFRPRRGARRIRAAARAARRRPRAEHLRRTRMKITARHRGSIDSRLRAFPRRHRDLYAAEMIDAFERELATRATSARARGAFVAAACLNVVGMGIVERHRQRRRRLGPAFSTLDFTLAWRMLRPLSRPQHRQRVRHGGRHRDRRRRVHRDRAP